MGITAEDVKNEAVDCYINLIMGLEEECKKLLINYNRKTSIEVQVEEIGGIIKQLNKFEE